MRKRITSFLLAALILTSLGVATACSTDAPPAGSTEPLPSTDTPTDPETLPPADVTTETPTEAATEEVKPAVNKTAVIIGGGPGNTIISQIVSMSGKKTPKVLLVPTAQGDDEATVTALIEQFKPYAKDCDVLYLFGKRDDKTTREKILGADVIYVAGGTTQTLMTYWKKYSVDVYMREAYEKGVILAGSSAGAICWTYAGFNDFSSTNYDFCKGIDLLHIYFGPHFQDADFAKFEPKLLATTPEEGITKGYALMNGTAMIFVNGEPVGSIRENKAIRIFEFTYSSASGAWTKTVYAD